MFFVWLQYDLLCSVDSDSRRLDLLRVHTGGINVTQKNEDVAKGRNQVDKFQCQEFSLTKFIGAWGLGISFVLRFNVSPLLFMWARTSGGAGWGRVGWDGICLCVSKRPSCWKTCFPVCPVFLWQPLIFYFKSSCVLSLTCNSVFSCLMCYNIPMIPNSLFLLWFF